MKQDKLYHIIAGLVIALAAGLLPYLESLNLFAGLWSAIVSAFASACVKEFCDKGYCLDPTTWDWKDIGFTIIGALPIALLILGMHYGKG